MPKWKTNLEGNSEMLNEIAKNKQTQNRSEIP